MSGNTIAYRPVAFTTPAYRLFLGVTLVLLALLLAAAPLSWASAGLAAIALGTLILIRPAVGLAAVALAIPFGNFVQLPGFGINGVDVLVALTITGWLARGIADRRLVFHRPPLTWSLLIFVWCAALSLTQAASWRDGLPEWFKWAEFAALYLVATQVLDRRSATWTLVALFAAGALQAALGAYQFINQAGPEAFIIQERFMRAYGTFGQPNPYAGYLGYLFPVAASLMLSALDRWRRGRERINLALAAACGALTGVLLMGIIMSWSRGAWLGVVAGSFVVIALRSRRSATLAFGALIVLTLFIAAFGTGWMPGIIAGRVNDLGSYIGGRIRRARRSPTPILPSSSAWRTGGPASICSRTTPGWVWGSATMARLMETTPCPTGICRLGTRTTCSSTFLRRSALSALPHLSSSG